MIKVNKSDLLYINHVIESIEKIGRYVSDKTLLNFRSDSMLYDAVIRNLQILAESTQKISVNIKNSHPEILWKDISGFRNILVHDYLEGIDENAVWNIIVNDLPKLKEDFEKLKIEF